MFEQATLSSGPLSTRLWSTFAGITGQMIVVGTMLLVPLIFPSTLPQLKSFVTLTAPGPPPPPAPPPPAGQMMARPREVVRQLLQTGLILPRFIPDKAQIIEDPPDLPAGGGGVVGSIPGQGTGGSGAGVVGSILGEIPTAAPPPPRPIERSAPPPAPAPSIRVPVGGRVQLGAPIHRVEPVYPPLARTARIEGVVVLEGVVGVDGRIRELKVKEGHPFLARAAVDAVQQWVYRPTLLNDQAVEVVAPITVTFRLAGR